MKGKKSFLSMLILSALFLNACGSYTVSDWSQSSELPESLESEETTAPKVKPIPLKIHSKDFSAQVVETQAETTDAPKISTMKAIESVPVDTRSHEEKLYSALEREISKSILEWEYYDYDGDGEKEAFAIVGSESSDDMDIITSLYFVSCDEKVTLVKNDFWGNYYQYNNSAENVIESRRYFAVATHNGGHSQAYLFGVVDGKAKEFVKNQQYNFFQIKNGQVIGLIDVYQPEGGFDSEEYPLTFNSSTGDFEEEKRTIEDTVPDFSSSSATCSSRLAPEYTNSGTYTYEPDKVLDGDLSTCWCEGVSGNGESESITIYADGQQKFNQITIYNGLCTNEKRFYNNSRVKSCRIEFSGGYTETVLDGDYNNQPCVVKFNDTIKSDYVKIIILSTYSGDAYSDTCISEIKIENAPRG